MRSSTPAGPVAHGRARTVRLGALAIGLVLTAAQLVGGTPAVAAPEPTPAPIAPPAIPQRYLDQAVAWQPCAFDSTIRRLDPAAPRTDCASVVVPMDWTQPDAHPDLTVAISYSYATGASRGLLTANPGGPGTPARQFTAALAVDHPELFARFDLLGMDPRGYGDSQRLTCTASADALTDLPTTADPRRRDAATRAAEDAAARLLAQACSSQEMAGFVSTQQTAYDLGFVRTLLGYTQLNLIGYGYGARLATGYAATYPAATGAVIADSGPDWSSRTAPDLAAATDLRRTQFVAWLARHDDTYHFGATPAAVDAAYARVRRQLATRTDPWQLDAAIAQTISTDRGFVQAAAALRRFATVARSGESALADDDAAALAGVRDRLAVTEHGQLAAARDVAASAPAGFSVDLGPVGEVVRCNDLTRPVDADQRAAAYPVWGYLSATGMCGAWPGTTGGATSAATSAGIVLPTDLPPVLIIQSAADPVSGWAGARAAHERASASVLVVVADSGQHDVALAGVSGCADRIALDYLLAGTLPGDTVCAAAPLPGDDEVVGFGAPSVDGEPVAVVPPRTTSVNPVLAGLWADAVARG